MSVGTFLKAKIVQPLKDQLTQGADAKSLAKSAAVGTAMSIIPVFSVSTWACMAIAAKWKLNQVVIQVFNYLFYAFQLALIPVFMSVGAKLTGAPPISFDVKAVIAEAKVSPGAVLSVYGVAWAKAVVVWAICAPVVYFVVYLIMFFIFSRILRKNPGIIGADGKLFSHGGPLVADTSGGVTPQPPGSNKP